MDSKEQKAEQSPVVTTVIKAKHPGRVAQGHKLAALMKERKQELVKNKDSELSSSTGNSTGKVLASHLGSAMSNFRLYGGIISLIAGGIYYLYAYGAPFGYTHRKAPVQAPAEKKQPKKWME